jgi:hypothetical protein
MNCERMTELLSEGGPLTDSAKHHLMSCAACRAMLQALTLPEAHVDTARISEIQRLISALLKPVRPLPSDRTLSGQFLLLFSVFSLVAAIPVGYNGFHVLNPVQRVAYYGLIVLYAVWFSLITVRQMIPGSKRKSRPDWTIAAALVSLALLSVVLFYNFDLSRFVVLGVPCLRLGSICALVSGGLFFLLLKRGFFTSPVAASTTMGFFAGLSGVAVLALHCPIQNSAHIIVWHLGAMVVAGLAGALAGTLRRRTAT